MGNVGKTGSSMIMNEIQWPGNSRKSHEIHCMTLRDRILAAVLGATDALWRPIRDWRGPRPGNTYLAREEHRARGVPWASGAGSDADRKAVERELRAMAREGLIHAAAPHGRTTRVKLTDAGEQAARRLLGLPGLYESWTACCELARLSKRRAKLLTDVWIGERQLAAKRPADLKSELLAVETMMLPALIRGFMEANSDFHGRASYRLTSAGWAWTDAGPPDWEATVTAEPIPEAWDIYGQAYREMTARLGTRDSRTANELGFIPLPEHVGGLEFSEWARAR